MKQKRKKSQGELYLETPADADNECTALGWALPWEWKHKWERGHSREQRLQGTLAPPSRRHSGLRHLAGSYISAVLR